MTRLVSTLLEREGIAHSAFCGTLVDSLSPGKQIHHWWIELEDGHLLDLRARMWMGDAAPHGAFKPSPADRFRYQNRDLLGAITLPLSLLSVVAGVDLIAHPRLVASDPTHRQS